MTTHIPSMKNRITFAVVSTLGYTKLRVTQFTIPAFEYMVCKLLFINLKNTH